MTQEAITEKGTRAGAFFCSIEGAQGVERENMGPLFDVVVRGLREVGE